MRLALACIAVALTATAGLSAQTTTKDASPTELKEQLVGLERQSWVAWQKRDGQFFASFLADDHVEMGAFGPTGKAAVVSFVGSPACKVESYSVDDFRLTRLTSDVALLVYRAEQKTTCGGAPLPSPAWVSSLYVYRDNRWQNAFYQQTPAAPAAPAKK